jgi:hypothetical protein
MKLQASEIKKLYDILTISAIGNISALVIEDSIVRGMNDDRSCVILSDHEVPKFGQKVGISRISALKSLLDIFMDDANVSIEAKESDRGEISQLEISAGRNKGQFRCTAVSSIKAPKSISDEPVFLLTVGKDELTKIFQGVKVKNAKKLAISILKNGNVSFQMTDANHDNLKFEVDAVAEKLVDEDMDSVTHYFNTDVFMSVIRKASEDGDVVLTVGAGGTITLLVNEHRMTIMPQVGEDE